MSESNQMLALKAAVYEMGLYFNQQPADDRITAYAKALANYTPQQVIYAFKQVINSGSAFFPSLAEILKHLKPDPEKPQERAPVIVAEMLNALREFSQYDEVQMLESVSEDARLSFLALGSTLNVRFSDDVEIVRAQLERLVKGVLASKEAASKIDTLSRIGIHVEAAKLANNQSMRKLGFSLVTTDETK